MSGGSRKRANLVLMAALASGKQVQLAAAEAGVSERTVFRRLASPEFQQQLAGVQSKIMDASISLLSQAFRTASEQLVALLGSGSEAIQLRAAQAILSQMTAVRMAILSDLRESRAAVASDGSARTLTPTDTDCQTRESLSPTDKRSDGQEWPSSGNHDNSCQPMPSDIRHLALSPGPSATSSLPPAATDCQTAESRPKSETADLLTPTDNRSDGQEWPSYGNHDKSCQPLSIDVRPLALSPGPSATASLPPTATECQSSRSAIPNRRRDRVKRPHLGWGVALPMSFQ